MASWSYTIDREKWKLALLGGIEVRRASGNEDAGNGGSGGAGGQSKPKYFHWTSQMYPYEYSESIGMDASDARFLPELTGIVEALTPTITITEWWSDGIIYSTMDAGYESVVPHITVLGMEGEETIYSKLTVPYEQMTSTMKFLAATLEVLLVTHTIREPEMMTVSCTVRGE